MNVSSVKNLNGEVFSAVQDTSLTNVIQTNSGNWQDITAYQIASATYLTAHQDLSEYATTAEVDSISSMLSGAIDYVSANAGDEFPASANDAITAYQTNSATYLTAHQAISADEWNNCYDNVNTNSGVWGGSALPISAGPGIKVNLVDNTLVFSNDETVLWESNGTAPGGTTKIGTLSEPLSNFKSYAIDVSFESMYPYKRNVFDVPKVWGTATNVPGVYFMGVTHSNSLKPQENNGLYDSFNTFGIGENMLDFYSLGAKIFDNGTVNTGLTGLSYVWKVIGINRIGG